MMWLFPVLASITACITLFISRPEKKVVAVIAGALTLLLGGWEGASQYYHDRTEHRIVRDAHYRLRLATNRFKGTILTALQRNYPEWAPADAGAFFGQETARKFCLIDAKADAPTVPHLSWARYVAHAVTDLDRRLEQVVFNQGGF